jgi:hypothetical protein
MEKVEEVIAGRPRLNRRSARVSLSRVGDDVTNFINRFHQVPGFERVLSEFLGGTWRQKQGARYVMAFVSSNIDTPTREAVTRHLFAFEQARGVARQTDVRTPHVRYEMKSVAEFRGWDPRLGRQIELDIADLLAQMPDSAEGLRWVFDANRLRPVDRAHIVEQMRQVIRRRFRSHPRSRELERWIEDIVVVW